MTSSRAASGTSKRASSDLLEPPRATVRNARTGDNPVDNLPRSQWADCGETPFSTGLLKSVDVPDGYPQGRPVCAQNCPQPSPASLRTNRHFSTLFTAPTKEYFRDPRLEMSVTGSEPSHTSLGLRIRNEDSPRDAWVVTPTRPSGMLVPVKNIPWETA